MAYVYQHIRLDTNEIFYIGIGKTKYRLTDQNNRNKYWLNIVNKVGYSIEIIAENISYDEALNLERHLIKTIGRKDLGLGPLVNMTDGGEGALGYPNSKDHLKGKTYEEIYGEKKAEAIKQKMKGNRKPDYKKGFEHAQFGKKRPDISANLKGKKRTDETKKKISDALKDKKRKPLSDEHKRKIGDARKGKKHTEESRKKMSEKKKGRKGRKGISQQKVECPYCKLSGGIGGMKRYHFENCNKKIKDIYLK
jgi:hypothetical protein